MFGYVVVNREELTDPQFVRYRAHYCGLCEALYRKYGQLSRILVNYDMTFLAMVLNSLYDVENSEEEKHCPIHPLKTVRQIHNVYLDYAADMTVLLAYYKMLDDIEDEKKKPVYSKKLIAAFESIKDKYSKKVSIFEERLNHIHQLEKEGCTDIDEISGDFGDIMAELFVYQEDEWALYLGKMGFYLGKFIYLMDGYDDVRKDLKKGNYNPFRSLINDPDYEEKAHDILESMMAECVKPYSYLPMVEDVQIMENVLYSGVWVRYLQIQNSLNKKKKGA